MDYSQVKSCYAAYSKNEEVRLASSSGGIFSLLAECILSSGGVVYGVAMSEDNKFAEFVKADGLPELDKMRGSKYVQARIGDTYKKVKKDLEEGIWVLFTGTECQIDGLKAFLGKEYNNLYCVDVICHGVPSPALWRKYVDHIEKSKRAKLISVNFRCKDFNWTDFGMKRIDSRYHMEYIPKDRDPFMQMFLRNFCLRPSCYECQAKRVKESDITIGDFWGIKDVAPEMNDNKGISFVIIRSQKGEWMFDSVKSRITYKPVSYVDGVKENPCDYESVKRPIQREAFFSDMNSMEFNELANKYLTVSLKEKMKRILYNMPICRIFRGGV